MLAATENIPYLLFDAKYIDIGHHKTTNVGYINHGCDHDVKKFTANKNAIIKSEDVTENINERFILSLLSVIQPHKKHSKRPPEDCKRRDYKPYYFRIEI